MKKFVTLGEVMQRLTPPNHDKLEQCTSLNVTYGGSEANIAIALSNFGHDVRFATKLPDNPLGIAAYRSLRQYGIDLSPTVLGGDILGTYYVEVGHSIRPSSVVYNRKHSAISNMTYDELNMEHILRDRTHLHVSGITLALGEELKKFTIDLVKKAFDLGLIISFDFNYRAKLWSVEEAAQAIRQVLPYVHVVFASLYDIETIGGYETGEVYETLEEHRAGVFTHFMKQSNCQCIFGTMREQHSTHQNSLSAYCYTKDGLVHYTKKYSFEIVDRVGAGDAFVAGLMNVLELEQGNYIEAVEYGLASGVLKHTINGDVLIATDRDIKELVTNNGSVGMKR